MHLIVMPPMNKLQILVIILAFTSSVSQGQDLSKLNVGFGHGYGVPAADLSERFGEAWSSTLGIYWHQYHSDLILGAEVSTFYGKTVKEDIFANLKDPETPFLGINSTASDIKTRLRGTSGYLVVEKIFTFDPDDLRDSGLKIGLGAGFMSHHIRIQDDTQNNAYFQGDYTYGYNRYTFGPAFKQFVGYHYANQSFNYNFSIGLEVEEGFTSSRRAVDFATGLPDDTKRVDILTTLKARFYLSLGSFGNTDSILY